MTAGGIFALLVCGGLLLLGTGVFKVGTSIRELLTENKRLKEAISNLTETDRIGAARVVSKELRDGRLYTKLVFGEYDRHTGRRFIQKKTFEIHGDIVHFDALIVKFGDPLIKQGEKSLFIWRRIYGDKTAPEQGQPINDPNEAPKRYTDLFDGLPENQEKMFWDSMWELAHDRDKLEQYGITAIYGSGPYIRVEPGFLYIFKFTSTGLIYPEIQPML